MKHREKIVLDERMSAFVDREVHEGRYGSVSEVIGAALRLLATRDARLHDLREALAEGEEGGFEPFDIESFLAAQRVGRPA